MTKDSIRYDLLVQDALKNVVRKVLGDAARDGLIGDHHYYVSFKTDYPGVRLSTRMRERYPEEMTIVLQHQFWDLGVNEHSFEVGLSFSGIPERLLVPFDALTGFFDPSVQFGLKFEVQEAAIAPAPAPVTALPGIDAPSRSQRTLTERGKSLRGAGSEPAETQPLTPAPAPPAPLVPATRASSATASGKAGDAGRAKTGKETKSPPAAPRGVGKPAADHPTGEKSPSEGASANKDKNRGAAREPDSAPGGGEVVSLDSFRKKT